MSDGFKLTGSAGGSAQIGGLTSAASQADWQRAGSSPEKVASGLESFFIFTLLKEMQKTTQSKKGFMQETYMSVVHEKLGEYLTGKGLGIKEAVMKYLQRDGTKVLAGKVDNTLNGDTIRQSVLSQSVTDESGKGQ
jgi:Rod binding domain-containing protein